MAAQASNSGFESYERELYWREFAHHLIFHFQATPRRALDTRFSAFPWRSGDAELRAVWTDPEFNPKHPAVYYARVLEIPTPTWQAYDMAFFDTEMKADLPRSHQERAYTSPIWYSP